jgi:colanic acid/amylovoran biosynthesis glycosyltransferase
MRCSAVVPRGETVDTGEREEQRKKPVHGITLIVASPLKAVPRPDRKIVLTAKFVDGLALYRELWNGPITLACEPTEQVSDNLDNVEVDLDTAPFRTICAPFSDDNFGRMLAPGSLVLASVGEQLNGLSRLCRKAHIPCVYITEYTLPTRLQIVREEQQSPLHGWWRSGLQRRQERRQVEALTLADGVQCNGTPTFDAYRSLTPMPLLFFDNRIEQSMLATSQQVAARLMQSRAARRLRLVFSGRLKMMKGVDHLPVVAAHLKRLGVSFEMTICGDGEYVPQLCEDIERMGVADCVNLKGNLDFKSELIPFVTNEADLFVCCHRQGDPSCTYLETMACGVPIVGYGNEALDGLARVSGTGWATPIGQPLRLAERIAALDKDRAALESAAHRALAFAQDHTFERTFGRRVDHLHEVAASTVTGGISLMEAR